MKNIMEIVFFSAYYFTTVGKPFDKRKLRFNCSPRHFIQISILRFNLTIENNHHSISHQFPWHRFNDNQFSVLRCDLWIFFWCFNVIMSVKTCRVSFDYYEKGCSDQNRKKNGKFFIFLLKSLSSFTIKFD